MPHHCHFKPLEFMHAQFMKPFLATLLIAGLSACSTLETSHKGDAMVFTDEERESAPLRDVLERTCVHCHGDNRLSSMPPMNDTRGLSNLISTGWIVPGQPDKSRFFQVVTFPDNVSGAMPPTGHSISKEDIKILRDWIERCAVLPQRNFILHSRGPSPRSI